MYGVYLGKRPGKLVVVQFPPNESIEKFTNKRFRSQRLILKSCYDDEVRCIPSIFIGRGSNTPDQREDEVGIDTCNQISDHDICSWGAAFHHLVYVCKNNSSLSIPLLRA